MAADVMLVFLPTYSPELNPSGIHVGETLTVPLFGLTAAALAMINCH
jgi:hypothetical protein